MRRREFMASRNWACEFLKRASCLHMASTTVDGQPVLRTLNPVVVGERVYFHGSPKGEKVSCVGRPAVLQVEHEVVTTPSYFVHPHKACPATTYFQSVQVHGTLELVSDPKEKALVLSALMRKFQPEGGYQPITSQSPEYRAALKGILVVGMSLENITGKCKLGQNRTPEELDEILCGLWKRGAAGDLEALELILRDNPRTLLPEFLKGPGGTVFCVAPDRADAYVAAALLAKEYWTRDASRQQLVDAHCGTAAWIVAKNSTGEMVATARAISDGARHAYIADVVVIEKLRGHGLGRSLMRLLLQHPALRAATRVMLHTVDASVFYESLGFSKIAQTCLISEQPLVCDVGSSPIISMLLRTPEVLAF